jgi:hypothetical protein
MVFWKSRTERSDLGQAFSTLGSVSAYPKGKEIEQGGEGHT